MTPELVAPLTAATASEQGVQPRGDTAVKEAPQKFKEGERNRAVFGYSGKVTNEKKKGRAAGSYSNGTRVYHDCSKCGATRTGLYGFSGKGRYICGDGCYDSGKDFRIRLNSWTQQQ